MKKAVWLALALAPTVWAQGSGRIAQVLVYPDGAEVIRSAPVHAGQRDLVLSCIPSTMQAESLRAEGSAGVKVFDLRVEQLPREQVPECGGGSGLETRIKALEEQKAQLQSDKGGLDLMLGYLKAVSLGDGKTGGPPNLTTAEALRKQGAEALRGQASLQQRLEELDRQIKPLIAQRDAERRRVTQWLRVTVALDATAAGQVTLRSQTLQAGWEPVYQANLQSESATVQFERRAKIWQHTGESWSQVKVTLTTREPSRQHALQPAASWLLKPRERIVPRSAAPAGASQLERVEVTGSRIDAEETAADIQDTLTDFDERFTLAQPMSLASEDASRAVDLDQHSWPAQLVARVQPQSAVKAYLLATLKRPQGYFPAGQIRLLRDGVWVGQGQWKDKDDSDEFKLYFGTEDRVRVKIEPEQVQAADGGFIGSRRVVDLKRSYQLENTGTKSIEVQLIEAAPFSRHKDIEVGTRFEPAPAETRWQNLDGMAMWREKLAARQTLRVTSSYHLSAPKDMEVKGWPNPR